jgi:hypothetical protein
MCDPAVPGAAYHAQAAVIPVIRADAPPSVCSRQAGDAPSTSGRSSSAPRCGGWVVQTRCRGPPILRGFFATDPISTGFSHSRGRHR